MSRVDMSGVALPLETEPQHTLMVGAPGAGKTVFSTKLKKAIREGLARRLRKYCASSFDIPVASFSVKQAEFIPLLPNSIKVLNFKLEAKEIAEKLVQLFSELPEHVVAVDFRCNQLGDRGFLTPPGFGCLSRLIGNLPKHVKALGLSDNQFRNRNGEEIAGLFSSIPKHIRFFDFSDNRLGRLMQMDLLKALSSIPKTLASLDLSRNDLGEKTDFELGQALSVLPNTIEELNLDWSRSEERRTGEEDLANIFRSLPSGLKRLGLGGIDFADLSAQAWVEALGFIPTVELFFSFGRGCFSQNYFQNLKKEISSGIPGEQFLDRRGGCE